RSSRSPGTSRGTSTRRGARAASWRCLTPLTSRALARGAPHAGRAGPRARAARAAAGAALGLPAGAAVLALIGQITPWKGQEEAVHVLARVRRSHPEAILLVVGETKFTARATRYDNRAYLERVRALVARLGLDDAVRFLGEREDVPAILRASDVA